MRFLTVLLSGAIALSVPCLAHADRSADEAAARALFERNLAAIQNRDAEAYLACYRDDPRLVRNGFEGVALGYDDLAAGVGDDTWPDEFHAHELEVFGIADGVVYGQYRYRVRYGDDVQEGISERVFVLTDEGWRIAVTTAFGAPAGALPPLDAGDGSR
ncbi:MAG TPA: nuclear transport factor 2 family protein [Candidatus Krumholzibacteria bacterium]|nr:nuclear transport factor 2 family protein [Candidatus Krumholzibacteria bacterium]